MTIDLVIELHIIYSIKQKQNIKQELLQNSLILIFNSTHGYLQHIIVSYKYTFYS